MALLQIAIQCVGGGRALGADVGEEHVQGGGVQDEVASGEASVVDHVDGGRIGEFETISVAYGTAVVQLAGEVDDGTGSE